MPDQSRPREETIPFPAHAGVVEAPRATPLPEYAADDFQTYLRQPARLTHATLAAVVVLCAVALACGYFLRIEVGVRAAGVVRPLGEAVSVTFAESGVVRDLLVAEGDRVAAGAVLARLDDREVRLALTEVDGRLVAADADLGGLRWALGEIRRPGAIPSPRTVPATVPEPTRSYLVALASTLELADLEREAAARAAAREREMSARGLSAAAALEAADAALRRAELQVANLRAGGERDLAARAAELEEARTALLAQRERLRVSEARHTLTAPVDGVVAGLSMRRPDQLAAAGTPLLSLLPDDSRLVVEVLLGDADRGRVAVGQPATVRFDAFQHERYGEARGEVASVAPDATFDAQGRPVGYRMVLRVWTEEFERGLPEGRRIEPGMRARVHAIEGRDRVLAVFFRGR